MFSTDLGSALKTRAAATLLVLCAFALPASANELQQANLLLKAGERQEALKRIDKVLLSKPKDPQARFLKGVILAEQGRADAAIDVFQDLTQDYPELPEPYNNLAVIYASQGQYEQARLALEQSIRTHPSYATAYENLGDVYARLASKAYDRALRLDSTNAGAQKKLAMVSELTGNAPAPSRVAVATRASALPATKPKSKPSPVVATEQQADQSPARAAAPPPALPALAAAAHPASRVATPPSAATRAPDAAVLGTVMAWAQAWSAKDVERYLGFYAPDFKTPRNQPRAAWEDTRRARVEGPRSITVSISDAKITRHDDDRATVVFNQRYRSDRFRGNARKRIELVREGKDWRILDEVVMK